VEVLISRLQYLDRAGKGLFDAVVNSSLNPFLICCRQLTKLVTDGDAGPVGVVFAALPHLHKELIHQSRKIGCDFGAQVLGLSLSVGMPLWFLCLGWIIRVPRGIT
jgi:hypothetical protein